MDPVGGFDGEGVGEQNISQVESLNLFQEFSESFWKDVLIFIYNFVRIGFFQLFMDLSINATLAYMDLQYFSPWLLVDRIVMLELGFWNVVQIMM